MHDHQIKITAGITSPLGATKMNNGINFAIHAHGIKRLFLLIYGDENKEPIEFEMNGIEHSTGDIWHIHLSDIEDPIEYAYKITTGANKEYIISDPYAKVLTGAETWGSPGRREFHSVLVQPDFDWENDTPPRTHLADSVIYEMHVRGFTRHSAAEVESAGTYAGVIEKIPYLKELGVTAVELLPITEFDESASIRTSPSGRPLINFWGYDPINFFAVKSGYARTKKHGDQLNEFKLMVREMHKAGIEVILDVVFNHTGEGQTDEKTYNLRALDNSLYYMMTPDKSAYLNFSGCGNSVNANNPVVSELIIEALRYWVSEMHVDGFRFDLASVLTRDENGAVLKSPPVLRGIVKDPILSKIKLIAEAWDAGGLYQVGNFPGGPRWAEWNGIYRDDLRRYVKGDPGFAPALATRIAGSADLYNKGGRAPYHSINFVSCHDGFSMHDLVSYNHKYNLENGENNRDGSDNNFSWNCGVEGATVDKNIIQLRKKQIKNFYCLLMVSQGTPMILAGDEIGRTQNGNNNTYCQDNEIGWIDWTKANENQDLLRFVQLLIAFRKSQPNLRRRVFFQDQPGNRNEIQWHGKMLNRPDWSEHSRQLAFHLPANPKNSNDIYVISNTSTGRHKFQLPTLSLNSKWYRKCDTSKSSPHDILPVGNEEKIIEQSYYYAEARSTIILISKQR